MAKELTVGFVVENGLISEEKTLAACVEALRQAKELEKADYETIPAALDKFWADNSGLKSITFDTLVSMAANNMQVSAAVYDEVKDRIRNFVRNHPDQYYIGKRDGVRLMARCNSDELKAIAEHRLAAAKKAAEKASTAQAQ